MRSILDGLQSYWYSTGPLVKGGAEVFLANTRKTSVFNSTIPRFQYSSAASAADTTFDPNPLFRTERSIGFNLDGITTVGGILLPNTPTGELSGPRGGTISLWFKETTGAGHGTAGGWICFRRRNNDVANNEFQFLYSDASDVYGFYPRSTSNTSYPCISTVTPGTTDWHHAILGFNPALGRGFLSIDGERIVYSDELDTRKVKGYTDTGSANGWSFGTAHWGIGATSFRGSVTQPIVWDRVLTREEMLYLYNEGEGRDGNALFAPMEQEYDPSWWSIASAIPTLTFPGVIDITATSARPQVTLTY